MEEIVLSETEDSSINLTGQNRLYSFCNTLDKGSTFGFLILCALTNTTSENSIYKPHLRNNVITWQDVLDSHITPVVKTVQQSRYSKSVHPTGDRS